VHATALRKKQWLEEKKGVVVSGEETGDRPEKTGREWTRQGEPDYHVDERSSCEKQRIPEKDGELGVHSEKGSLENRL